MRRAVHEQNYHDRDGHSQARFLRLTIKPERKDDHLHGQEQRAYVDVCAHLMTAQWPGLKTLFGPLFGGGAVSSSVSLAIDWFKTMAPPTSCATLEVTYHVRYPDYKVERVMFVPDTGSVVEGVKCDGPAGEWRVRAEYSGGGHHIEENLLVRIDERTLRGVAEVKAVTKSGGVVCTETLSRPVYIVEEPLEISVVTETFEYFWHCTLPSGVQSSGSRRFEGPGWILTAVSGDFCKR